MAKEMGLDRAPIEFRKLVFLVPPNVEEQKNAWKEFHQDKNFRICTCVQQTKHTSRLEMASNSPPLFELSFKLASLPAQFVCNNFHESGSCNQFEIRFTSTNLT